MLDSKILRYGGFEVGVWGWIWVFIGGFVRLGCEGIFMFVMVFKSVDSPVCSLYNDGLDFGLWFGVRELWVFEV